MAYDEKSFQAGIVAGRALIGKHIGATGGDTSALEKAMTDARIEFSVIASITIYAYMNFVSFDDMGTNWTLDITSQSMLQVEQGWNKCFIMPPRQLLLPDSLEYPTIITVPDISGLYTVEEGCYISLTKKTNDLDGEKFSEKDGDTVREMGFYGDAYRMELVGAGWGDGLADMMWKLSAPIFVPYGYTREVPTDG